MTTWLKRMLVASLLFAVAACGSGEKDEVAELRRQVEALRSQIASPTPSPSPVAASSAPVDAAANADCPGLAALGFTRDTMLEYWYTNGRPTRLDGDGDGVPCDITFPGEAEAPPAAAPAPKVKQPAGVLELLRFNNTIEYSDTCAHVILFFANRSDTAIATATVNFHGTDAQDRKIDLGKRLVQLGLAPYQENRYDVKVCDERMGGQEYGPGAIPDGFTWEWFR